MQKVFCIYQNQTFAARISSPKANIGMRKERKLKPQRLYSLFWLDSTADYQTIIFYRSINLRTHV